MAEDMEDELPFVSVIVPCRNEAKYLEKSLGALAVQDYAADRFEIIVVDGMSEDGSSEIARELLSAAGLNGRVIPNPERVTPAAFNLGLELAQGDVIIIVSAHSELAPDYMRLAVETLEKMGADCVGGPWQTRGLTRVGSGIALALISPFGVGAATYRTHADRSGFVDTVPFGAYRRDVFDRVGHFDPEFIRNQDSELNFRIKRSGGRIYQDSRLRSVYYCRSTLGALWRQHFRTGASKVQILAKHGRMPRWGHYIPGAFVAATAASLVLAVALRMPFLALSVLGPYAAIVVGVSAWTARHEPSAWPIVAVAMPTLHFSYGLGFLFGLANLNGRALQAVRRRSKRS